MIKVLFFATLALSVFAYDTCFVNIGNVKTSTSTFYEDGNSQSTLSDCKSLCDTWDSFCETVSHSDDETNPCAYLCENGVVTDEGCNLYEGEISWEEPENDDDRYQAFEKCDPSCWELSNGYECWDEDVYITTYDGEFSYADCKAECLAHNIANYDGDILCGGIEISSESCILTERCTTVISSDEGDLYYKFTCLDEYQETTIVEEEEVEEDDEEEVVVDDNVSVTEDGSVSCKYTEVFEECDYQGESMQVALVADELDWEPKSWCIPEYQTLTLHNAYFLEGESISYTESVSCHDTELAYSLLQLNRKPKNLKKRIRVSSESSI